jgi:hypothetical protein
LQSESLLPLATDVHPDCAALGSVEQQVASVAQSPVGVPDDDEHSVWQLVFSQVLRAWPADWHAPVMCEVAQVAMQAWSLQSQFDSQAAKSEHALTVDEYCDEHLLWMHV